MVSFGLYPRTKERTNWDRWLTKTPLRHDEILLLAEYPNEAHTHKHTQKQPLRPYEPVFRFPMNHHDRFASPHDIHRVSLNSFKTISIRLSAIIWLCTHTCIWSKHRCRVQKFSCKWDQNKKKLNNAPNASNLDAIVAIFHFYTRLWDQKFLLSST